MKKKPSVLIVYLKKKEDVKFKLINKGFIQCFKG